MEHSKWKYFLIAGGLFLGIPTMYSFLSIENVSITIKYKAIDISMTNFSNDVYNITGAHVDFLQPEYDSYIFSYGKHLSSGTKISEAHGSYNLSVAIVLGMTTKLRPQVEFTKNKMRTKMSIWKTLIPSFCKTASSDIDYHFYFGFDKNDLYLNQDWFRQEFTKYLLEDFKKCPNSSTYSVHYVKCTHNATVAWAQNDAVLAAYMDGMEYIYRINDDTVIETPRWTEDFITCLQNMNNIGICGPNHRRGNTEGLTYEFVHRTHVNIMGFHYPRAFPSWDGDVWISQVYKNTKRYNKLHHQRLLHTLDGGTRYKPSLVKKTLFNSILSTCQHSVERYIATINKNIKPDPKRVISMSLSVNDSGHMWGLVRNAQLMKVIYPHFVLRLYVFHSQYATSPVPATCNILPEKTEIILKNLGVDIHHVTSEVAMTVPSSAWKLLVADDPYVDVFLVRNENERLSEIEAETVTSWLESYSQYPVHCIRDHPSHNDIPLPSGLWGANGRKFRDIIGPSIQSILQKIVKTGERDVEGVFLKEYVWPKVEGNRLICHDNTKCIKSSHTAAWPRKRTPRATVGTKYNEHEEIIHTHVAVNSNGTGCLKQGA